MITQEELKIAVTYDPETGIFTWNKKTGCKGVGMIAGSKHHTGYIYICINHYQHPAHRFAWLYVYGKWPDGEIDHINLIRDDNRIINLRDVNRFQNMWNKKKLKNKTGFTGVSKSKDSNRWMATITCKKKVYYLGIFKTPEEAHMKYIQAKENMHRFDGIK